MKKNTFLRKFQLLSLISISFLLMAVSPIFAQTSVAGIHILNIHELDSAKQLLTPENSSEENKNAWHYVVVPLTLADLEKSVDWQIFFDKAKEKKIIPLVRLTTRFENEAWQIPNRKEIVELISFLNDLNWPTDKKHIIIFNEVNHAKEWGGKIDPQSYGKVLAFASNWARSENNGFVILPAAMDLAAPNSAQTMEAFNYLTQMHNHYPDIFEKIDVWNSHSYPNPAFSAPPDRIGQNSLLGFKYELDFLKAKTGKDFQVFITETGWEENAKTSRWLDSYYMYAFQHIWSDSKVIAVTPFILKGSPGPFSRFSFFDENDKPTRQNASYQNAIIKNNILR